MSGVRGIAKNLSSLFSSHVVAVLQQVALVPLYIHVYGKAGYGEWLTLSAAVSYLGTLDFGVQTFVNQDLTVKYHRGEMQALHVNQSTALRLLLGIVVCASLIATLAFVLPLQHMLKMDGNHGDPVVPAGVVQSAVFFLALQALTGIIFGYFSGTFMVFGRAHIGGYWTNIRSVVQIASAAIAVTLHATFAHIAMSVFSATLLALLGMILHLRHLKPEVFPTLRYWEPSIIPRVLGQSGYFMLIYLSTFLVYQLPIIILQRSVGGTVVTLFSVMRTIFSMTRNLLSAFSQAMGPEVTKLHAQHDWKALGKLYDYSERLIFSMIPIANVGVLYLCPFLLTIWIKQPKLFVPEIYLVAAATSIVISTKEHKFQFQFSTNTHKELARFMFGTYLVLGLLWAIFIPRFGVLGLMLCWLGIEFVQTINLVWLNAKFFRGQQVLDKKYLYRLGSIAVVSLAIAAISLPHTRDLGLALQVPIAIFAGLVLLGIAIPVYHLAPLWGQVQNRLRKRFA